MGKLIRLEWKKNHIETYGIAAAVLAFLLCIFILALAFAGIALDADGTLDAAPGADRISAVIEMFTSMIYLIFTGVMLARFVVDAYKNKIMNLMFTYSIRRQKILAAQILAVWIFSFAALILTRLAVWISVDLAAKALDSPFVIDVDLGDPGMYVQLVVKAFVIVTVSLLSLFAGLKLRSSKAVIIVSFLLVFLMQGNIGDLSLAENRVFPAALTAVSLALTAWVIRGAEKWDLLF